MVAPYRVIVYQNKLINKQKIKKMSFWVTSHIRICTDKFTLALMLCINFMINPTLATKSGSVFYPEFVYTQPHVYSVPVDCLADDWPWTAVREQAHSYWDWELETSCIHYMSIPNDTSITKQPFCCTFWLYSLDLWICHMSVWMILMINEPNGLQSSK